LPATSILEVKGLVVEYKASRGTLRAVDGVNLEVMRGETFTVIGESGSGKSTLGLAILRLIPVKDGEIIFNGINLLKLKEREIRKIRKSIQIVLQDPYASLDPKMKVKEIVSEPLIGSGEREGIEEKVNKALELVGLDRSFSERYPSEFSGGQRQRVSIARAIVGEPEFIVLDEPTSNLDISIQAQILNLLLDLQERKNLTYLFITHNIAVAKYISDRIAVMYSGEIIESGDARELITNPLHPYTTELISAVPSKGFKEKLGKFNFKEVIHNVPPKGCKYAPRCPFAKEICWNSRPKLVKVKNNHDVSCFLYS